MWKKCSDLKNLVFRYRKYSKMRIAYPHFSEYKPGYKPKSTVLQWTYWEGLRIIAENFNNWNTFYEPCLWSLLKKFLSIEWPYLFRYYDQFWPFHQVVTYCCCNCCFFFLFSFSIVSLRLIINRISLTKNFWLEFFSTSMDIEGNWSSPVCLVLGDEMTRFE